MPRAPVCPFFGYAKNERLTCLLNGPDSEGSELLLSFPNAMCRVRYWVGHCCGSWKQCTLAAALWEDYEKGQAAAERDSAERSTAEKSAAPAKPAAKAGKKPAEKASARSTKAATSARSTKAATPAKSAKKPAPSSKAKTAVKSAPAKSSKAAKTAKRPA